MKSKFGSKSGELFGEERGVSPVIGVILMVAIVVILAAVIGFFVLGLSNEQNSTPQASFSFDNNGGTVTITHDGGDTLQEANVNIVAPGATTVNQFTGTISAGSSTTVTGVAPGSGKTIRVVYENDNGQTSTLATYTA